MRLANTHRKAHSETVKIPPFLFRWIQNSLSLSLSPAAAELFLHDNFNVIKRLKMFLSWEAVDGHDWKWKSNSDSFAAAAAHCNSFQSPASALTRSRWAVLTSSVLRLLIIHHQQINMKNSFAESRAEAMRTEQRVQLSCELWLMLRNWIYWKKLSMLSLSLFSYMSSERETREILKSSRELTISFDCITAHKSLKDLFSLPFLPSLTTARIQRATSSRKKKSSKKFSCHQFPVLRIANSIESTECKENIIKYLLLFTRKAFQGHEERWSGLSGELYADCNKRRRVCLSHQTAHTVNFHAYERGKNER